MFLDDEKEPLPLGLDEQMRVPQTIREVSETLNLFVPEMERERSTGLLSAASPPTAPPIQARVSDGWKGSQIVINTRNIAPNMKGLYSGLANRKHQLHSRSRSFAIDPAMLVGQRERKGKGITVVCRIRPQSREEQVKGIPCVTADPDYKHIHCKLPLVTHSFGYDRVFDQNATTEEVYDFIGKPLIEDLKAGYNGAVFAYGQTGSGKTFTMMGGQVSDSFALGADVEFKASESIYGIMPRLLEGIFENLNADAVVSFSFCEVYNEKVTDLLDEGNSLRSVAQRANKSRKRVDDARNHIQNLRIWEPTKERGHTILPDVISIPVRNAMHCLHLTAEGNSRRRTGSTSCNEHSSRSHAIMILIIHQRIEGTVRTSQLYLVDLAGSEKVSKTKATGLRLEEAKKINSSLLTLGKVIHQLVINARRQKLEKKKRASHIPYRDSKLTRILKPCLGGNSKTKIIICVSPSSYNAQETLSTLRFGSHASLIRNEVKKNVQVTREELSRRVRELQHEMKILRTRNAGLIQELEVYQQAEQFRRLEEGTDLRRNFEEKTGIIGSFAVFDQRQRAEQQFFSSMKATNRSALLANFLCPLTMRVMINPVIAGDGHTYERDEIQKHIDLQMISPLTGDRLPFKHLIPNIVLKKLIENMAPDLKNVQMVSLTDVLGPDMIVLLFTFLDFRSLSVSGCVCKEWNAVYWRDVFWRTLLRKDYNMLRIPKDDEFGNKAGYKTVLAESKDDELSIDDNKSDISDLSDAVEAPLRGEYRQAYFKQYQKLHPKPSRKLVGFDKQGKNRMWSSLIKK